MGHMTQEEQVMLLLRRTGVMRTRDFVATGVARETLRRLSQAGIVEHVERGLYRLPSSEVTERHMFAEVSARVPQGVLCLLSALRFHDLTTQNPMEIWLAIGPKARPPRMTTISIQTVHFSGMSLTESIESHEVEGVTVRVYSLAKTVVDCFKFRHRIGIDIALEALHEAWRAQRVTMDDLWPAATIDRVTAVIRPYLESLEMLG